ncbi:MAG: phosphomannomutase/phosphoglucomutase [Caldilineales bacterium]|nr:phosphomannomutase/phosphoglucomutase [Caldilineales bacterium]
MSIFKSCDIRGIYGDELTPDFAYDFGRAVGTAVEGGRMVVGGDARPSTPHLKGALIGGLIDAGCFVADTGLVPTSALYFAQDWLDVDGAIMVTASHNPPGYNGFKLKLGAWPIFEEELLALRERIERRDFRRGNGYWDRADVLPVYQSYVESFFEEGRSLRVVADAGNGCMSEIAPATLRRKGYDVIERFCEIDGRFPNRDPNPAVAKHVAGLAEQVVAEGADLGIAFDGDGDRVVFVDDRGTILPGDRALIPFIRHRLPTAQSEGERKVVYDIKCSGVVRDEIARLGGIPVMERAGHAFIKTTLMKTGAGLAGEISGHYFFGELQRDDALFASLLMLQILSESGQPLSALMADVPAYAITPDLRLPCPPEERAVILDEFHAAFADHEVSLVDGVRVQFANGWALARASVTEPLITLRFEGRTQADLQEIQAQVLAKAPRLGRMLANRN